MQFLSLYFNYERKFSSVCGFFHSASGNRQQAASYNVWTEKFPKKIERAKNTFKINLLIFIR